MLNETRKGWVRALPRIRFNIMSSVNKSTGYSPFQLRFSKSPRVLPPLLLPPPNPSSEHIQAREVINCVRLDVTDARDNLMLAKISQSYFANKNRADSFPYKVGDLVMLSTLNRHREYKNSMENRVVKFIPRFNGPYLVTNTHHEASTVSLEIPSAPNVFPTFHSLLVKPFRANNDNKFPSRTLKNLGPIVVDGHEEFFVDCIIDHRKIGKGFRYLVHWRGEGPGEDRWIKGADLDDNKAVDVYWATSSLP